MGKFENVVYRSENQENVLLGFLRIGYARGKKATHPASRPATCSWFRRIFLARLVFTHIVLSHGSVVRCSSNLKHNSNWKDSLRACDEDSKVNETLCVARKSSEEGTISLFSYRGLSFSFFFFVASRFNATRDARAKTRRQAAQSDDVVGCTRDECLRRLTCIAARAHASTRGKQSHFRARNINPTRLSYLFSRTTVVNTFFVCTWREHESPIKKAPSPLQPARVDVDSFFFLLDFSKKKTIF